MPALRTDGLEDLKTAPCERSFVSGRTCPDPVVSDVHSLISFAQNTELDRLRLTKSLTLGRARVRGMVDLYNVLNDGTVLGSNGRYGTAWLTPMAILAGRTLKFGGQFEF